MKITKSRLKQIIKEELSTVMQREGVWSGIKGAVGGAAEKWGEKLTGKSINKEVCDMSAGLEYEMRNVMAKTNKGKPSGGGQIHANLNQQYKAFKSMWNSNKLPKRQFQAMDKWLSMIKILLLRVGDGTAFDTSLSDEERFGPAYVLISGGGETPASFQQAYVDPLCK